MRMLGPAPTHACGVQKGVRTAVRLALLITAAAWLHGCGGSLNSELAQTETKAGSGLSTEPIATTVKLPREAEALTAAATPGSNAYKVGPQDVIEILVFKVPELSRAVQVADNGTVNLPLIGDVAICQDSTGMTSRAICGVSVSENSPV